ncbi:MAG: hypothetical protein KA536_20035 [Saprospiraceae bacterium]|nr:hypothetical protein [Saprospiraceae bacterium]
MEEKFNDMIEYIFDHFLLMNFLKFLVLINVIRIFLSPYAYPHMGLDRKGHRIRVLIKTSQY